MNLLTLELAKLKHRGLNNKQKTFPKTFHAENTAHCKEKKSFVHQKVPKKTCKTPLCKTEASQNPN